MHSVAFFFATSISLLAAPLRDESLQNYFTRQVAEIESQSLSGYSSRAEWEAARPRLRAQLFEMLSLDPLPARTDLKPVITGKIERDDFIVEKLHFQSSPGLYVTANFYRPKKIDQPLPTILYLCGHAVIKTNGISYGNKVGYQHHGAWFARNGYACLMIDTVQLGEIEGIHHGTYREGMWWWNSRGYSSAGVEAWNAIRALDYLETRPEVDKGRFGVTGRSGGGAYSWWVAALDDRIKVAAPVAGITDLRDHVIDGVVEGHCDCMYFVNTYRWDYPTVAALVAPRPLLIGNSDKDTIFPLDGVQRAHAKVANIYQLLDASANLGLLITEGPHKDTQDLQLPVFRWFNRHLKGEDPIIEMAATKFFTGQELRVFDQIPADEITSRIHETFVPTAPPRGKPDEKRLAELRAILREKVFGGWPKEAVPFNPEVRDVKDRWKEIQFDSEEGVRLKLFYFHTAVHRGRVRILVTDQEPAADELSIAKHGTGVLVVRSGPEPDAKDRNAAHLRRRYNLVGQTLEGMRVWDILRGIQIFRTFEHGRGLALVSGVGRQAENALLARFMLPPTEPHFYVFTDHKSVPDAERPDYLNLLRFTSWDELQKAVNFGEPEPD
jgi:dienelactone hydrolase